MATDPMSPEVLVSLNNEMEAAAIINALADHGIRAKEIGSYTAGFKAEAPGQVSVVVAQADATRAQKVLAEIRRDFAEIDWSTVDYGGDQPPSDQKDRPTGTDTGTDTGAVDRCRRTGAEQEHRRFQFGIASLLVLQTVVSVVLALWRSLGAGTLGMLVLFGVLLGTPILILVVGTVSIASDLNRARETWVRVGRLLSVGFVVIALPLLILIVLEILDVTF